jgi:hypothetical protein
MLSNIVLSNEEDVEKFLAQSIPVELLQKDPAKSQFKIEFINDVHFASKVFSAIRKLDLNCRLNVELIETSIQCHGCRRGVPTVCFGLHLTFCAGLKQIQSYPPIADK